MKMTITDKQDIWTMVKTDNGTFQGIVRYVKNPDGTQYIGSIRFYPDDASVITGISPESTKTEFYREDWKPNGITHCILGGTSHKLTN